LWHSWTPAEEAVLQDALEEFGKIHPRVTVATVALPPSELLADFEKAASDGTAPSLLLGSDVWVRALADAGWIGPLADGVLDAEQLRGGASASSEYRGDYYGVPISLSPSALYFNKALVDVPATTLDDLLLQAGDGKGVAMVPRFEEAFWGIQAFGRGLIDAEGNFTLADSGFSEWLHWLKTAQEEPRVILNEDDAALADLFIQGRVAYYVAGPEKQKTLIDAMGEDAFGVVALPAGPNDAAGPLLPTETVFVYAHSSPEQHRIADSLARFLGNQQQSIRFMREAGRVPTNPQVRVDARLYPALAGFAQQAKTAVILPNELIENRLYELGDRAFVSVLSGASTPEEAVCEFGREVARIQGYTDAEISLPDGCEVPTEQPTSYGGPGRWITDPRGGADG
jgi:ABC-type glycerol-3-phosphate transport system substrate-binding protein